jgi:hypothetical protein
MATTYNPHVINALLAAQKEVEPLEHDSTGYEGRRQFSYVSAEQLIDYARALLLKHNLLVIRVGTTVCNKERPESQNVTTLFSEWSVIFVGDKYESMNLASETVFRESHGNPLDKSCAAAETRSLAYFLRDLLLIPRFHPPTEPQQPEASEPQRSAMYRLASDAIRGASDEDAIDELARKILGRQDLLAPEKSELIQIAAQRKMAIRKGGSE